MKIGNSGTITVELPEVKWENGRVILEGGKEDMIEIVSPDEEISYRLEGSIFYLRRMDAETHSKITAKHTKHVKAKEEDSPRGEIRAVPDGREIMMESLCYVIKRWEGVRTLGATEDLPCTDVNKRLLPIPVIEDILLFLGQAKNTRGKA